MSDEKQVESIELEPLESAEPAKEDPFDAIAAASVDDDGDGDDEFEEYSPRDEDGEYSERRAFINNRYRPNHTNHIYFLYLAILFLLFTILLIIVTAYS